MRRLFALPLVALVVAASCAAASAARDQFRITEARAPFPERAYVLSLPTERRLDSSQVQLFENGKRVTGLTVVPSGAGSARQFGVVLLIDASESMQGAPELAALAAARVFAAQRRPQEQIAVVTYNVRPSVLLPSTADETKIDAALSKRPTFQFGTHIYDAIVRSIDLLKRARITAGSIVLLSDGQEHRGHHDTAKHQTEASAAAAARKAHIRVFTVGLRSRQFRPKALRAISRDTGAQYSTANSLDQLIGIYQALGAKFAREYLVSYRSAAGPGAHVGVAVRVAGLPGIASSGYRTPSLSGKHGASAYHESPWSRLWRSPLTMIFVAFLVASLVAFAVMAILMSRKRGTLRRRMAQFVSIPEADQERPTALLSERVEEGTEKVLARTRWWGRLLDELELAGIGWSPRRIVLFTFIGTFISVWLLSLLTGSVLISVLLGLAIPFGARMYVRRKVARKRYLFAEQLPDNLQVLSSALRAGHSFISALSVVVDDAPEPSRAEFRRVISDEALGVPLEDALHVVVERMESRELEQVALVAAVQRSSGGNTAEVLDRVVETIRERFELRRTVRTLTAQGRLSRWVVSLLPVFLLVAISLLNPGYMRPFFASTGGRIALIFAGLMVITGSLVIKRIVSIKV